MFLVIRLWGMGKVIYQVSDIKTITDTTEGLTIYFRDGGTAFYATKDMFSYITQENLDQTYNRK